MPYNNFIMIKQNIVWSVLSFSCVIHCIVAPFIVIISPLLGSFFENHLVEWVFLVLSIGVGMGIVIRGFCIHKRSNALWLYLSGAILWLLHSLFEHMTVIDPHYFLLIGTGCVLVSYYLNHISLKGCPADCCNER